MKSTNKRKKKPSSQQQQRTCVCGNSFGPRAYGRHVRQCIKFQKHVSTQRVYHNSAAAIADTHHSAMNLQQDSSMHQQRQWITSQKAAVEGSVVEQRHTAHKASYVSQLRQMTTTTTTTTSTNSSSNSANNDNQRSTMADDEMEGTTPYYNDDSENDNEDDCSITFGSDATNDNEDDCSITFGSDATNAVNDEDEAFHDDEREDEDDMTIAKSEYNANVHSATAAPTLPPIFPILNEFDRDKSIRFDGTVAPCTAAGIKLMELLENHSVDLSLYDDIVRFIGDLADTGYNFGQKIPKRQALHKQCEEAFNYSSLRPKLIEVPVATLSTPTVTVPVFDIQAVLSKMLRNPLLMQQDNFAANYDIFTGKPIRSSTFEDNAFYDEIHTGKQWPIAVDHYCGECVNAFPCGLVVFYDKSHADRHGSLAVSPIMFTLTLFNKAARAQCKFWDVLAYVPNLDSGTNKTADSSIGLDITSAQKCQDEHVCLSNALRQLEDVNKRGGIPLRVMGKDVSVKVWIHIMVGDISGNNSLLGSYNAWNVQCPYRDCSCSKESFIDPDATCTMIRKSDIDQMKNNNDMNALQAASKHNIINAFDTIPTGNPVDSIYHLTPPETMHAICSGIAPRMIVNIGEGFKRKNPAAIMQNLHLLLVRGHSWQSERNASSRPSSRNHIFDSTKTQATEHMGNLFLIMCALHTTMGRSVCIEAGITEPQRKGKIETIMMVLSLEKWFNRRTLRSDVDDNDKIQSFIRRKLIPNLLKYFPRDDGAGWMFPKVHSLTKFATYIQLFGSGINFYGGFGESNLKTFMKKLAHFTQRRSNNFAIQLGENHYQQSLFAHSSFAIRMQTKTNYVLVEPSVQHNFKGCHSITFTQKQPRHVNNVEYRTDVKWKKTQSSKPLDDVLKYAISRYMANSDPSPEQICVTAYTTAKLPNNEENLEPYDAGPSHSLYVVDTKVNRFDWCMILTHALGSEQVDERLDTWEYACPAQIHGFFRFDTGGVPTPCLLQKWNAETIRTSGLIDETMYVVVRTHRNFLTWKELEKKFVVPIELGTLDECTYILPVSRIVNPLYVFEDHGQSDTTGPCFFATLPARYSAFYLDYKLNPQLITGEGGLSQKCNAP